MRWVLDEVVQVLFQALSAIIGLETLETLGNVNGLAQEAEHDPSTQSHEGLEGMPR